MRHCSPAAIDKAGESLEVSLVGRSSLGTSEHVCQRLFHPTVIGLGFKYDGLGCPRSRFYFCSAWLQDDLPSDAVCACCGTVAVVLLA